MSSRKELMLWYEQPAKKWVEALPLGNGRLAAMVFGGYSHERLQLNEGTLWSGEPQDKTNPESFAHLAEVRELLFQEKYTEASNLLQKYMLGSYSEAYEPLGNIYLEFAHQATDCSNYERNLDLTTAIASVRYTYKGMKFEREYFISAPDQIMIIRLTVDHPHQLSVNVKLDSLLQASVTTQANVITLNGRAPYHSDPCYHTSGEGLYYASNRGMTFQAGVQVLNCDGHIETRADQLKISNASEIVFAYTAATSFNGYDKNPATQGKDPAKLTKQIFDKIATQTYSNMKDHHISDYQSFFNRVQLSLGSNKHALLPTDKRLERLKLSIAPKIWHEIKWFLRNNLFGRSIKEPDGGPIKKWLIKGFDDPQLISLYFQYGRYLMISASRPGSQPMNLQGLWNEILQPPWSSNYTTNINTQMNYWCVETCGLSECHQPLLDAIKEWGQMGQKSAQVNFHCKGWVEHHNSDLWRMATPVAGAPVYAFWPMGGGWLTMHLWDHYLFTKDLNYLRNFAYPLIKGSAEFYLDWLIEDKQGHLVTAPSTSPENTFIDPTGHRNSVSIASTMDMAIIWSVFTEFIQASQILNIDQDLAKNAEKAQSKLLPYQIGKWGQLQEWSKDFDESEPGHRHMSHLLGLHPGFQISPRRTPQLAAAAKRTLDRRFNYGGPATGWSCAWKINHWARLESSEDAYLFVVSLLRKSTFPNLFDAHPPFQIDGNFGGTAGIAEMLVQSHAGEINLLPALPKAWAVGEFCGLRARGGFIINLSWKNGLLFDGSIIAQNSDFCILRYTHSLKVLCENKSINCEKVSENVIRFQAEYGKTYQIHIL